MADKEQVPNQEPTDVERAKFESDVLKAAQDAMNLEKNLNEKNDTTIEQTADLTDAQPELSNNEKLINDLAEANEKISEANDRYIRLMAEFDNFRRRSAREQLDIIETANGKLLEKLSEVLDNFERAFATENKSSDLETFEKGMQMIHDQFAKVLTDSGLEQIDPQGEEFDPNCHEALMQQPSEEIPEGHVITVFMKGYKLKNKILKPAKVIVSSGK